MTGYKHRLNQRFIQKQIQALGDTCTIVDIVRTFDADAYREATETKTLYTDVKCFVNILTEQDTSVEEGEARAGDLIFNFDYSYEPYLKQMNRIIWNNQTFQISDVRPFQAIGNVTFLIECFTKKYSDGTAETLSLTDTMKANDNLSNIHTP
jgi:hypothetical protein